MSRVCFRNLFLFISFLITWSISTTGVSAENRWSGIHAGVSLGGHFSDFDQDLNANTGWGVAGANTIASTANGDLSPDGFIGGLFIGYNWQSNNWVFGVEGDISFLSGDDSRSVTNFTGPGVNVNNRYTTEIDPEYLATLRAKIGYSMDQILIYATAGLAVAGVDFQDTFGSFGNTSIASSSSSETLVGFVVGAGAELSLSQNLAVRIEYLYMDFGSEDNLIPSCTACVANADINVEHDYRENIIRLGVGYKF